MERFEFYNSLDKSKMRTRYKWHKQDEFLVKSAYQAMGFLLPMSKEFKRIAELSDKEYEILQQALNILYDTKCILADELVPKTEEEIKMHNYMMDKVRQMKKTI